MGCWFRIHDGRFESRLASAVLFALLLGKELCTIAVRPDFFGDIPNDQKSVQGQLRRLYQYSTTRRSFTVQQKESLGITTTLSNPEVFWKQCADLPQFGTVCVALYDDPTSIPAGVGLELDMFNTTFYVPVLQAVTCIDDVVLLRLLLLDPDFTPLSQVIKTLAIAERLIRAEAIFVCVLLTDLEINKNSSDIHIKACPIATISLGCFRKNCLVKEEHDFECIDGRIPQRHVAIA